ncbi:STM3941 family protein [Parabacteroides sp. PF5-6]|uniref:STM3941 family protein n=1 Tax=Parabacteroides sp. PF5-6 TaxID=1742403 RepID=UPI0024056165|nr:STM3941 family protein [Parabacteroides sp. PF5-6]MDF9828766.1 hypothetical protein [Parabacteroides sp. PF5-6]
MVPNVITFTLARKEKIIFYLITFLSGVIGFGGVFLAGKLAFGGGRFIVLTVGVFSLIVMFFCLYSFFRLRKEEGVGIYISDEGIYDISTGNTYGTVVWSDVEEIRIMDDISDLKHQYIVVRVKNPTAYIQREQNKAKQHSLELKLQFYGTPICFSNRTLNCTFEQLKDAVFLKYNQYKEQNEAPANE